MALRRSVRIVRTVALLVGLGLAAAATAALVLTEDLQLLRLAVIAALWAFLIAAFVVAGQRRPGVDATEAAASGAEVALRQSHELELEREVAKRRECELRTEVRLRREIEGVLREDMSAVQRDLTQLRHDILERWDGELRVERIAVRAESTRVSGFGATFHALKDEARRLHDEGRPLFEVEIAKPHRDELDTVSTVEFSVVPPPPTVDEVVAATRAPSEPGPPTEPIISADHDPPVPASTSAGDPLPTPGDPGRRARHEVADEQASVDAAALFRRIESEAAASPPHEPVPRRRRHRGDDETNDVLARLLGR